MPAAKPKNGKNKRTSMWLDERLLKASAKKAASLGISRALYFQQLLRKDLGMEGIDLEVPSVFR
jgi:hypothetical protein